MQQNIATNLNNKSKIKHDFSIVFILFCVININNLNKIDEFLTLFNNKIFFLKKINGFFLKKNVSHLLLNKLKYLQQCVRILCSY